MTKKHFRALADAIRWHNRTTVSGVNPAPFSDGQIGILADFCKSQNPRFDRELWLDYTTGKCGPDGERLPDKVKARQKRIDAEIAECLETGRHAHEWLNR